MVEEVSRDYPRFAPPVMANQPSMRGYSEPIAHNVTTPAIGMLPSPIPVVVMGIASTIEMPPARIAIPSTIPAQPAQNATIAIIRVMGLDRVDTLLFCL
jgi:hypothetical protein